MILSFGGGGGQGVGPKQAICLGTKSSVYVLVRVHALTFFPLTFREGLER